MAYEDFALEVMDEMPKTREKTVNPLVVAVIAKVIELLITKCILDRYTMNNPGIFKRMQLWNYLNQIGKAEGLDRQMREDAYYAMLKRGKKVTQADVDRLRARAGK